MRYAIKDISRNLGARGEAKATDDDREKIMRICADQLHFHDVDFGDLTEKKMALLEWVYLRGAQESYLKIIAAFPSSKQREIILASRRVDGCEAIANVVGCTEGYARVTLGHAMRLGIDVKFDPDAEREKRAARRMEQSRKKIESIKSHRRPREVKPVVETVEPEKPKQNADAGLSSIKHHMRVSDAPDGKIDFTIRISPMEIGVIIGALHEFRKNVRG